MNQIKNQPTTAPAGPRILAALVDYIIHGITIAVLVAIVWAFTGYENAFESIMDYALEGVVSETYITYQVISIVSAVVSGFIYYGIVPTLTQGQTIGKKMFNIKALKADGTPPSLGAHLLRAVMLYGTYFSALFSLAILIDDFSAYESLNAPFSYLASLIVFVSLIMILARNDRRGLHDLLARTHVVFEESETVYNDDGSSTKKEDPFEFDYDTLEDE
ncbi:MAG: RDD family protein [Bacillota bacterium]